MRADHDAAALQNTAANRPREHQRRGQPAAEMSAAAPVVMPAVPLIRSKIRMSGTRQSRLRRIIARTRVFVGKQHGQRRAGGFAVQHAGNNAGQIPFLPRCRGCILPGRAARLLQRDRVHIQRFAGGQPLQHAADGLTVTFSENRYPHPRADTR